MLATIEAMKMEHSLRAPNPGMVSEIRVRSGDQVANGEVLIVVDEDEDGADGAVTTADV